MVIARQPTGIPLMKVLPAPQRSGPVIFTQKRRCPRPSGGEGGPMIGNQDVITINRTFLTAADDMEGPE